MVLSPCGGRECRRAELECLSGSAGSPRVRAKGSRPAAPAAAVSRVRKPESTRAVSEGAGGTPLLLSSPPAPAGTYKRGRSDVGGCLAKSFLLLWTLPGVLPCGMQTPAQRFCQIQNDKWSQT